MHVTTQSISTRHQRSRWLSAAVLVLAAITPAIFAPVSAASAETTAEPDISEATVTDFLDRILPAQLAEYEIPGAAVVVVSGGQQVVAKGYGVSDVERDIAVDPEQTGMFTASVAKLFTATAVQQLVEEKKLDLDRDVNEYLTRIRVPDTYPGEPITTRHLLTHTAGFDYVVLGAGAADDDSGRTLESYVADQPARARPPGRSRTTTTQSPSRVSSWRRYRASPSSSTFASTSSHHCKCWIPTRRSLSLKKFDRRWLRTTESMAMVR